MARIRSITGLAVVVARVLPVVGLTFAGCHGYSITGGPGKTVTPSLMSRVERSDALLHVNSIFMSPIKFENNELPGAERKGFDAELGDAFRNYVGVRTVAGYEIIEKTRPRQLVATDLSRAEALAMARVSDSDSILETIVHRYVEREGSGFGANRPASVSFSIALLDARDGHEVWQATYAFKDQALSDNLFSAEKRGAGGGVGWKSAQNLLSQGIEQAARDLAEKRAAQFMTAGSMGQPEKTAPRAVRR